ASAAARRARCRPRSRTTSSFFMEGALFGAPLRNSELSAPVLRRRNAALPNRSLALLIALCAASVHAATERVVFVDNRAEPGGVGTVERPFTSIGNAMRVSHEFDVIYVAETSLPYRDTITLRRGQMLIGSAYGLDAVRAELHVDLDAPPTPAARGAGPMIEGSIAL